LIHLFHDLESLTKVEEEAKMRKGKEEEDILLISPLAVVEDIKQLIQVQTGY